MAESGMDSFEVIPQRDDADSQYDDSLGVNNCREAPYDEYKSKPQPKSRNRNTTMKKVSRKSLRPDDIKRCVEKNAVAMSDEAIEEDYNSLDVCVDDLLNLHEFGQDHRNETGILLNQHRITEKLVGLLETSYSFTDENPGAKRIFLDTLKVCLKFTESSPAFTVELASHGTVKFLSKSLNFSSISSELDSPDILTSSICILHNIAVSCGEDEALFAKARTPQALKKFASHEVDDVKVASLLTLGYICSDYEIQRLKIQTEDIVTICVEWLKESLDHKRTRREACLQPWAIISGLTRLAVNDQMSQELNRRELINCVSRCMSTTLDSRERAACMKFLKATNAKVCEKSGRETIKKQKSEPKPGNRSTQMSCNPVQTKIRTTKNDIVPRNEINKDRKMPVTRELTEVPDFDQIREVDLLLIGKTGNGKSSVGNTIIGRNAFNSCSSSTSVTRDVTFDTVKFEDRFIKVVDGPGVADTDGIQDLEKVTKVIVSKMQHAVTLSPAGYHAFLLVVKFGNRFTAEDHACINILKHILGEDCVRNYCILLMTCGDNFKEENEILPFKEWCQQQSGDFKKLLNECNNKVVLFDNRKKDESVRHEQIKELLRVVDTMQFAGKRYTNDIFQSALTERKKLLVESKEPMITEDTVRQVSFIIQELEEVHKAEEESQKEKLVALSELAQHLHRHVLKLDKGTGVLKLSIETAENLVKTIADRIYNLDKILTERQELFQKQEELETKYKTEIHLQEEELERLRLEKRRLEETYLERDEHLKRENEKWSREIEEREKTGRQKLQNKRNELNETFHSKMEKIQIQLNDPSVEASTRKTLEQEREKLKSHFKTEILKIEAQEKELAQMIHAERKRARDEIETERNTWKSEVQHAQYMIDKNITDMQQREKELKKEFEAEKEEMGTMFMEATKHIVGLNDLKHNKEKALLLTLYEKMKQSYQDSAKEAAKKEKSSCVIS